MLQLRLGSRFRRFMGVAFIATLFHTLAADASAQSTSADEPLRLEQLEASPDWLVLRVGFRTRYEHLSHPFRAGLRSDDQALSLRTNLLAGVRFDTTEVAVELMDSRMLAEDDDMPVSTSLTNALDILQAYARVRLDDAFAPGSGLTLTGGRFTMDVGSRRLVARNRFRNTINAFTGIHAQWSGADGEQLTVFATLPVIRQPSDAEALSGDNMELDTENENYLFWGAHTRLREVGDRFRLEGYVFGLLEEDWEAQETRNRELVTPGLRLLRARTRGEWDLDVEATAQLGSSRASKSETDTNDLTHRAYFLHAAFGYSLEGMFAPRLVLMHDYASGDTNPNDDVNGRYDTLFGARRFEFGPTGIFGALARSNINSPSMRLEFRPDPHCWFIGYRAVWLAAARDAWTTSGLRDTSGDLGAFIGHQIEMRARWRPFPENVTLEAGFAHLWRSGLALEAPDANPARTSTYVYTQLLLDI